jgi:hypothetical protein
MTQSLYEQHRENFDALASKGFPGIAQMARHFTTARMMDDALGLYGAAHHWVNGTNGASRASERKAQAWLDANVRGAQSAAPIAQPAALQPLLLVAAPPERAETVKRVLAMMGCEVTEI